MAVYVYKKDGDRKSSSDNLIKLFTRKVQQSGVLMHVRKNRFATGPVNKTNRRKEALYKKQMKKEVDKLKKIGRFDNNAFKELKKKLKKENNSRQ